MMQWTLSDGTAAVVIGQHDIALLSASLLQPPLRGYTKTCHFSDNYFLVYFERRISLKQDTLV